MKRYVRIVILVLVVAVLTGCPAGTSAPGSTSTPESTATTEPTYTDEPSATPKQTDTSTPDTYGVVYGQAFGIDYTDPELYLQPGEQSQISDVSVLDDLRSDEQGGHHIGDVWRWLKSDFETWSAGGATIGVVTVDQLLDERRLGGCHDHGLVYAATLRELGYPAVMVRTVSIVWAHEAQENGTVGTALGHTFVEVYMEGRWVLVDSTNGFYVATGYDPSNPVIPLKGSVIGSTDEIYGFYVEVKGVDTWDMGIFSPQESSQAKMQFALAIDLDNIVYPEYEFRRMSGE